MVLISWVQVGVTIILVIVTIIYVIITFKILSQARISAYDTKMPVLVFKSKPMPPSKLVKSNSELIVNIGSGPALDIYLKSNGEFQEKTLISFNKKIKSLNLWPQPLDNCIGPCNGNLELQICFNITCGELEILKNEDAQLLLEYKDIFGRKYKTRFENKINKFESVK